MLKTFIKTFSIDDGLKDDELAMPPAVHRDSMIGMMLKMSTTKDMKMSDKLMQHVGSALKINGGLRRRVADETLKLWAPAFLAANSPDAVRYLSDEDLFEKVTATKIHIESLPSMVKDLIFNHIL